MGTILKKADRHQELYAMSDTEIEKLICTYYDADMLRAKSFDWDSVQNVFWCDVTGFVSVRPKKYCSSLDAVMPLVFENEIRLGYIQLNSGEQRTPTATHLGHIMENGYSEQHVFKAYDKNPLKAFCMVLILIMEERRKAEKEHKEFMDSCEKLCKCCKDCNQEHPCESVMCGNSCDDICDCDSWDGNL